MQLHSHHASISCVPHGFFNRLPTAEVEDGTAPSVTDAPVEILVPLTMEPECEYFSLEDMQAGQI